MSSLLVHNTSQLLTLAGTPQRGEELGRLGAIADGAVLIEGETIAAVGPSAELLRRYPHAERLDAGGMAVLPGLIDPHTHLVWAGDRANEFEMRLQGKTYMEIMSAGGGIASTVKATRTADPDDLYAQTRARALGMFRNGTTSAEAKSGYGLELNSELTQLSLLLKLNVDGPLEISPTFLGAHAIAPEYANRPEAYTDLISQHMLPNLKNWWGQQASSLPLPFVDVFCEEGVFDLAQTRRILSAAKALGFPLKLHVDEFANLGGATLAAELGAVSADHLVKTSAADIQALAASDTVAVALPCTPFGLAQSQYTPAKDIIAAGGLLAIASDINPGTAWCESMQFVIALACRSLKLTPAQALAAATINAAAAIRRADVIGSLEPGKQADLLFLSVPDYRHLAYRFGGNLVETVIKKGNVYFR
jgi:imidazolonepropionase